MADIWGPAPRVNTHSALTTMANGWPRTVRQVKDHTDYLHRVAPVSVFSNSVAELDRLLASIPQPFPGLVTALFFPSTHEASIRVPTPFYYGTRMGCAEMLDLFVHTWVPPPEKGGVVDRHKGCFSLASCGDVRLNSRYTIIYVPQDVADPHLLHSGDAIAAASVQWLDNILIVKTFDDNPVELLDGDVSEATFALTWSVVILTYSYSL